MKTNCAKPGNFRQRLGLWVSAGALCLLGLTALGQTAPKSPVGTWGCVMSGQREGLATMAFLADGTFESVEILVLKPAAPAKPNSELRNNGGTDNRNPYAGNTNPVVTHVELYGRQDPASRWGFDSRGRVIGNWYEFSRPVYTTNALSPASTNISDMPYPLPYTNASGMDGFCITQTAGDNVVPPFTNVSTCYRITALAITNRLSFVGTVVPGKRLSLVVSTPNGKVTYSGVPDTQLPDLSGSWYGGERQGSLWNTEFYTLTPWSAGSNIYEVEGSGPGYVFTGTVIVVPQKKLAMVAGIVPVYGAEVNHDPVTRSVVGPANLKRLNGSLHGLSGVNLGAYQRLKYSMQRQ